MPEKSRQRRTQIAKKEGRSTAIKSSDVGMAKGLSRHAAKKSSHVEGMRHPPGRSVGVKSTPGHGKGRVGAPAPEGTFEHEMEPLEHPPERSPRVEGFDHNRSTQRVLSERTPARIAAEKQRKQK